MYCSQPPPAAVLLERLVAAGWCGVSLGPASVELASVVHGTPAPTAPALPRREGAGVRVCMREVTATNLSVCVRVCVSEWAESWDRADWGPWAEEKECCGRGEREGGPGSVGRGIPAASQLRPRVRRCVLGAVVSAPLPV